MKLVKPNEKYQKSYYELVNEAIENEDVQEMGNAYRENEEFSHLVKRLKDREKGKNISKRDVPATVYFIIENSEVVGTIDLRHVLNKNYFERLGHIAYYIKPSKRNKGIATKALGLALKKYEKEPIARILITSYEDNLASRKVIENNGGKLEKIVFDEISQKNICRYCITLNENIYPRTAWLTTNRTCNCKCSWCYAGKSNYDNLVMDYTKAKEYIAYLKKAGIKKVILIGGEPTIYPNIDKIIFNLNKQGIRVSMATNGKMFANFDYTKKVVKSGLQGVNISIKGISEEEYIKNTKVTGFKEMVDGYHNLIKLGIEPSLSYVICNNNSKEINDLYEMLVNNDLNNITFLLYKPSINGCGDNAPTLNELANACEKIYQKFENSKINYVIEMSLPLCVLDEDLLNNLIIKGRISTCCHISKGTGIIFDTKFNILPCNHFMNIPMNTSPVLPEKIIEFWNSSEAKDFRNKIRTYPTVTCSKCSKWSICGGGCFLRWLSDNPKDYITDKYTGKEDL